MVVEVLPCGAICSLSQTSRAKVLETNPGFSWLGARDPLPLTYLGLLTPVRHILAVNVWTRASGPAGRQALFAGSIQPACPGQPR